MCKHMFKRILRQQPGAFSMWILPTDGKRATKPDKTMSFSVNLTSGTLGSYLLMT